MLSMVIPTYNEKENIKAIIVRIFEVFKKNGIVGEVIVVDDNSKDGTGKIAESLKGKYDVKVIVRKDERGLSSAVLRGFKEAKYDIVGVIDADLSHPPEVIPRMLNPIRAGKVDFTLGSRYIEGGGMKDWPLRRQIISKGATMLARPLTKIHDPMSGYMMVRKSKLKWKDLNPMGYKIALEILVKCKITKFREVPIIFKDREAGTSKLNWKEQINYLVHLKRLYHFKYKGLYEFFMFCLVGGTGMMVDVGIFSLLYYVLMFKNIDMTWAIAGKDIAIRGYLFAQGLSFCAAVTSNFFLNRTLTFESKGRKRFQYPKFFTVAVAAFAIRTVLLYLFVDNLGLYPLLALIAVILIVTILNFLGSKLWAFKK